MSAKLSIHIILKPSSRILRTAWSALHVSGSSLRLILFYTEICAGNSLTTNYKYKTLVRDLKPRIVYAPEADFPPSCPSIIDIWQSISQYLIKFSCTYSSWPLQWMSKARTWIRFSHIACGHHINEDFLKANDKWVKAIYPIQLSASKLEANKRCFQNLKCATASWQTFDTRQKRTSHVCLRP